MLCGTQHNFGSMQEKEISILPRPMNYFGLYNGQNKQTNVT